jgi:hypothetical protein
MDFDEDLPQRRRKTVVLRRSYDDEQTEGRRIREERDRTLQARQKTHAQYLSWDVRLQLSRKGR